MGAGGADYPVDVHVVRPFHVHVCQVLLQSCQTNKNTPLCNQLHSVKVDIAADGGGVYLPMKPPLAMLTYSLFFCEKKKTLVNGENVEVNILRL